MKIFARVISRHPLIVIGDIGQSLIGTANAMAAYTDEAFFLLHFWAIVTQAGARAIAEACRAHKERCPNHKLLYLANDLTQLRLLRSFGIPSIEGNHNLFASENIYKITNRGAKDFDAIYNANMNAWKRHNLCSELQSVALMYYFNPAHEFVWYNQMRDHLPNASFLNSSPETGEYRFFSKDVCVKHLNNAKVGLCLSAHEGAMYASIEYLLCGLPIVTTPNEGGRNHFFRPDYAIEVEPSPAAVARGVAHFVERNIDPDYVRNSVLRLLEYSRDRFFQEIWDRFRFDVRGYFERRFSDKMYEMYDSVESLLASWPSENSIVELSANRQVGCRGMSDLAFCKPALTSSTSPWSRSIDPSVDASGANGDYLADDFGFHTACDSQAWWAVDMLLNLSVYEIAIVNRESSPERFRCFCIETSCDNHDWTTQFSAQNPVAVSSDPMSPWRFVLPVPTVARYLRIRLLEPDFLHLRRVQIFGIS